MKHISNFDNFTKSLNESTLDFLIGVMQDRYNKGRSLKKIYDEIVDAYGHPSGPDIFLAFAKKNMKNAKFKKEFDSTYFVDYGKN